MRLKPATLLSPLPVRSLQSCNTKHAQLSLRLGLVNVRTTLLPGGSPPLVFVSLHHLFALFFLSGDRVRRLTLCHVHVILGQLIKNVCKHVTLWLVTQSVIRRQNCKIITYVGLCARILTWHHESSGWKESRTLSPVEENIVVPLSFACDHE